MHKTHSCLVHMKQLTKRNMSLQNKVVQVRGTSNMNIGIFSSVFAAVRSIESTVAKQCHVAVKISMMKMILSVILHGQR